MNAEGGDDADLIAENLFLSIKNAKINNILYEKYYYLCDILFEKSEYFQGVDLKHAPEGTRIEQIFYLWRQCPPKMYRAVMEANGLSLEPPFDDGITVTLKDDGTYVTLVDINDFDIENRGSFTLVFEPDRDVKDITKCIAEILGKRKMTVKDMRTKIREMQR
ncbi:hypothetical protein [Azospirillum argentinense]